MKMRWHSVRACRLHCLAFQPSEKTGDVTAMDLSSSMCERTAHALHTRRAYRLALSSCSCRDTLPSLYHSLPRFIMLTAFGCRCSAGSLDREGRRSSIPSTTCPTASVPSAAMRGPATVSMARPRTMQDASVHVIVSAWKSSALAPRAVLLEERARSVLAYPDDLGQRSHACEGCPLGSSRGRNALLVHSISRDPTVNT